MAGELPRDYLDGLLDTVNILLASKSREVSAAFRISFIKYQ
jgi:hypothetical protein